MKRTFFFTLTALLFFGGQYGVMAHLDHRLYDLQNNKELLMSEAVSDLKKNRIILVGEHHTNRDHHYAQLNVIAGAQRVRRPGGYRPRDV